MASKKTTKKPGFLEKKTGERYTSKTAMKRHEKTEPMSAMTREYGKKKATAKMAARKR